jgi:uncharacterized membrane protein YvbJ
MPFCTDCGTQYSEGQRFCNNCGKALVQGKELQTVSAVKGIEPKPKSRSLLKRLGIVVIGIIAVLFIAVLLGVLYFLYLGLR